MQVWGGGGEGRGTCGGERGKHEEMLFELVVILVMLPRAYVCTHSIVGASSSAETYGSVEFTLISGVLAPWGSPEKPDPGRPRQRVCPLQVVTISNIKPGWVRRDAVTFGRPA